MEGFVGRAYAQSISNASACSFRPFFEMYVSKDVKIISAISECFPENTNLSLFFPLKRRNPLYFSGFREIMVPEQDTILNAKQSRVQVCKETWQKRLDLLNWAKFIHKLEGYINFVGQVRGKYDPLYTKYKASFDGVFALE